MYYMCVHNKMEVDNFVVLQIGEKIKVLVYTISEAIKINK